MKKWNADSDRRSRIDRRSGIDRRLSNVLEYFSSGGVERRSLNERRSDDERRYDWFRISRFCSVYMAGTDLTNITSN